jgi:hypothetical protein
MEILTISLCKPTLGFLIRNSCALFYFFFMPLLVLMRSAERWLVKFKIYFQRCQIFQGIHLLALNLKKHMEIRLQEEYIFY